MMLPIKIEIVSKGSPGNTLAETLGLTGNNQGSNPQRRSVQKF